MLDPTPELEQMRSGLMVSWFAHVAWKVIVGLFQALC